jgi:hypothetical protein
MKDFHEYCAITPDGKEHFGEVQENQRFGRDFTNLAYDALQKHGYNTHRNKREKIKVKIVGLRLVSGKTERQDVTTVEVEPPIRRMTKVEYEDELTCLLTQLPEEFQGMVSSKGWEDGHSSGYEEVLSVVDTLIGELKPCIEKYTKRVKSEDK